MFDTALTSADLVFLAKGAGMTLLVTAISVVLGTILGVIFGVFRTQVGPVWAAPLTFVLDVFRSIPLLIQLVLANAFMGMVLRLQLSGFTIACGVLTLYTAAYCASPIQDGSATRVASGMTMLAMSCRQVIPSERAARRVVMGTASMPPRTISAQ